MISTFYSLSIAKTHPNTSWTRGVFYRIDIDVRFNVYLCIQKTIRNYYHTLYTAPRASSRPALQYAVPLYPRPQRPQNVTFISQFRHPASLTRREEWPCGDARTYVGN
jgi:hypothetical protein